MIGVDGGINDLVFHGAKGRIDVSESVIDVPSIDLTSSEVSQLSFTVVDPFLKILATGLVARKTGLNWGDVAFEVASVELKGSGGSPMIDVKARPAGVQRLKEEDGPSVQREVSPTDYAREAAKNAGLAFVGEPSTTRGHVGRPEPAPGTQGAEEVPNQWDVLQDLAGEIGYICFESAGTLFFARPSWLIERDGVASYTVRYPEARRGEIDVSKIPTIRRADVTGAKGNDEPQVTIDGLEVPLQHARHVRPGDRLRLEGIPTFVGDYLVTAVVFNLDGASPAILSAQTPVDSEPKPPGSPSGYDEAFAGLGPPPDWSDQWGDYAYDPSYGGIDKGGFIWPVRGTITGRFGDNRKTHRHAGLDIAAPTGKRVVASRSGRVTFAGSAGAYGNLVKINHGGGMETRYAHLSRILTTTQDTLGRSAGDMRVAAGQTIGLVGSTGRSTGPHLHFEIRKSGAAVDPMGYLGDVGQRIERKRHSGAPGGTIVV